MTFLDEETEVLSVQQEERSSLIIERQRPDVSEELVSSSPKVAGEKRKRKSESPRVVEGNLKSNSNKEAFASRNNGKLCYRNCASKRSLK